MTHVRQTPTVTGSADSMAAVSLLLAKGKVNLAAEDPERVMEDLELRATQFSSVLEDILREPHGRPDWGLNE